MVIALVAALLGSAATPPTIEDTLEVVDLSSLAISPDGRQVAFRTEQASLSQNRVVLAWHSVPLAGGADHEIDSAGRAMFSDAGVLRPEAPLWSADCRSLYFRALLPEGVQILRGDPVSGRTMQLTHEAADIERLEALAGENALAYVVGPTRAEVQAAEDREYDDGVRVDKSVDPAQAMVRGAIINGRHATQRFSGAWFARQPLLADAPRLRKRLDLSTLEARSGRHGEGGRRA